MRNADARTVRSRQETFNSNGGHEAWFSHFQLPITSLFMVRNIKCGYSFSYLGWAEHFETKFERIRRNFLVCIKIAYCKVSPYKWRCLVWSLTSSVLYDVIYLTERQWSFRAFKLLKQNHFCEKYIFFHTCIPFGTPLTMVDQRENKR